MYNNSETYKQNKKIFQNLKNLGLKVQIKNENDSIR